MTWAGCAAVFVCILPEGVTEFAGAERKSLLFIGRRLVAAVEEDDRNPNSCSELWEKCFYSLLWF